MTEGGRREDGVYELMVSPYKRNGEGKARAGGAGAGGAGAVGAGAGGEGS